MDIPEIEDFAKGVLKKHPLVSDYKVEVFDFKRRYRKLEDRLALGWCFFNTPEIQINAMYLPFLSDEDIKDVVLHEISHAIAYRMGGDQSHGKVWKIVCWWLGCSQRVFIDVFDES